MNHVSVPILMPWLLMKMAKSVQMRKNKTASIALPNSPPSFTLKTKRKPPKAKREEERRSRAASKSRLLAELRGELDDAPEEESIDPVRMASRVANDHRASAREAYEEENFIRFKFPRRRNAALKLPPNPR